MLTFQVNIVFVQIVYQNYLLIQIVFIAIAIMRIIKARLLNVQYVEQNITQE